ncbi:bifunctional pantoate--beta-alanine ligase/(d)CMP kinase [Gloeobacter morelensis]|uniref:Bifunctional pantoate ligase/cytidylate kinase n=1 Tax=Gloeobacter morelensis MG652769 TaxID=2781736 RepID=A0ABY3PRA5_9CYAN|nr:bifunctional pantoate--beta-alanine ligase/(d)CMP kinase [Gloeobacter morelensis]UFP96227.1 bifunctional pantoate--beta-alanine ligase/(d)CMP kinase [Gloeobacter morelensis MG652769]
MKVVETVARLEAFRRARAPVAGVEMGLVMTMGALHEGHRSLLARARRENTVLVVSIFVNPAQFSPNEDLSRYPRPLADDLELCRHEGVDLVFVPPQSELYPPGFGTKVVPDPALTEAMCGLARPGHFSGVATVVAKVMNLVQPVRAYFGQKDAQQVAVIQSVCRDLNIGGRIVICPTVRDPDGLALSSRNVYLNPEQRSTALALPRALDKAAHLWAGGERRASELERAVRTVLASESGLEVEYVAAVDPERLTPHQDASGPVLVAAAVRVGSTRLIDNVVLGQHHERRPIIAIDGPAGAGKSTLARRLAQRLGFLYIDTGAMYRAVTWRAMQERIDPLDGERLSALTRAVRIRLAPGYQSAFPTRVWVDGEEVTRAVRDEAVSLQVSAVSSHPGVRSELVAQQRRIGEAGGVILDGRDIGTHVFPRAELKIYLTASVEERALRRAEDLKAKGLPIPDIAVLKEQIRSRDNQDMSRAYAPLRKADDAIEVNTDTFTVQDTLDRLLALYRDKVGGGV